MASLREQILARMAAALTGTTPAGVNVFRSRETAITRALTPAIVVMPDSEQDQRMGQTTDKHELVVTVAVFSRGDPWDQLTDPVCEAAHRVLLADQALSALVLDIRKTATDFEAEEADRTAGTATARYRITYLSKASDISAAP